MATYLWSTLADNATLAGFNPANDVLYFDDSGIHAAGLLIGSTGTSFSVSYGGKTVNVGMDLQSVTATNITFDNDSLLIVGDTSTGTVGDSNGNDLTGGLGQDQLLGLEGDDTLEGGAGDDVLVGGPGRDTYFVEGADTVVELIGEGVDGVYVLVDSYTLPSNVEHAFGNDGMNHLTGNELVNLLEGFAGDDELNGMGGNDTLVGMLGNDTLIGGAGDDRLYDDFDDAVASNDTLSGGEGDDLLVGQAGDDTLDGGAGDDILRGDDFDSTDDAYDNNDGADTLTGGEGADTLTGGGGWDTLDGGAGNDRLDGGLGGDVLVGGPGDDTYQFVEFAARRTQIVELPGEGTDEVRGIVYKGFSISFTLPPNVENATTNEGNVALTGNDLDNRLIADSGFDHLYGMGGNDTLYGRLGNDTLDGGAGNDNLRSDDFNDTGGVDTLAGGAGDDVLWAGGGNDTLDGGAGNDILDGGGSVDSMTGGSGDDFYYVNHAADTVHEAPDEGIDTVSTSLTSYTLPDNVENLEVSGSGTGNALDNRIVSTAASNDLLIGLAGNNYLDGGAGIDTADYSAAPGGVSINTVTPGTGSNGYGGTDTYVSIENFTGSAYNDLIAGDGAANRLDGEDGADYLVGLGGNDTLVGGTGAVNTLQGGAGNDLYIVSVAGDSVLEFANDGTDEVRTTLTSYTLGANVENLTFTGPGAVARTGTGNGLANTLVGGAANDTLDGRAGNDTLVGGAGNDTYFVDAGDTVAELSGGGVDLVFSSAVSYTFFEFVENLTLIGAARNGYAVGAVANILTGNELDNFLSGGGGNDTLYGMAGNDTLDGSTETDTMVGGTGDDTYYVQAAGDVVTEAAGEGTDTVLSAVNYSLGGNVENLSIVGTALTGTGNGLNNNITGNNAGNTLTGANGDDVLNGLGGSDMLDGGNGNDTLDGGAGNDTMSGGTGNDTYRVDSTSDVATEAAGEGTDSVISSATFTLGANVENLQLSGTAALDGTGHNEANTITGNLGNNILRGLGGDDVLNGGAGNDTMVGGTGNDTYYVDAAGDVVTEAAGEGTDKVYSSINYTLGANLEDLTLIGNTVSGTGNAGNNYLTGNGAANTLSGRGGNDTLYGAGGNDTMIGGTGDDLYYVDAAGDVIVEAAGEGADSVISAVSYTLSANLENLALDGAAVSGTGNAENNSLLGTAANNTLTGGGGNDILNGLNGNDTMVGGTGDDTYYVQAAGDVVTEASGEGTDTVYSAIHYTLGANVENLVLTGGGASNGTGNGENNTITGSLGNNVLNGGGGDDVLNGGAGNDTMIGGTGNDTYYVDTAGDVVTEVAGAGTDKVYSAISYTLGANLENLTLTGTLAINATGNAQANTLIGNSASNVLDGGAGIDVLFGAGGDDILIYDAADSSISGSTGEDRLRLTGSGQALDLTLISDSRIQDVEIIDLTGSGNNSTTLSFADVLPLSSTTNTLRIDGNAGDQLTATDAASWATDADQVIGSNRYHVYVQGQATLMVDTDVMSNL